MTGFNALTKIAAAKGTLDEQGSVGLLVRLFHAYRLADVFVVETGYDILAEALPSLNGVRAEHYRIDDI